jgi:ligand-binding sensor domain-containing protein
MGKKEDDRHMTFFAPGGPSDADNIDLYVRNNEVWVAHGGISGVYLNLNRKSGLSHFVDDHWETLTGYNYPLFYDTVVDFLVMAKDERTGTLYAGTFTSGIYERKADKSARMIKQGELQRTSDSLYTVTGLAVDGNGYLWVNQSGLSNELAVKSPDGVWYHYPVPKLGRYIANSGARIIVDDLNQKWYLSPFGGGVIVYNDGGTPETNADDDYRNLLRGKGQGDLPSNTVLSLVKDRDGAIWIGTDKGIGIASSPSQIMADKTSDVEQRIVQYDQFAGYLFANESVGAMAVDGANRKWVGTTNGVWLLSPDASKIISRFTVDNSPLPSNVIQSIAVDAVTGDVYFGTPDGLVSFHGTATEGKETASDIKTFPSPIPSGYNGPITMKGFTTDADVRITDIAGQLVYRAKSAGGQLVWNGLDYTGHRPQSGVLLIFATNKDGSQTAVGKLMLMH